ncbi:SDR family oxidoreductase [Elioraea sp. Yellowstone]|uniref:SDR family NAD(P)-dependent oxidoreductase n=1 Tax=Elioraea sp. Yellowstone TaxID=2592070 RepID=UPI001152E8FC|nr:SDR family oxidoreductase [Elioraea sp. Yellowstone]TQF79870.1 SDR family oxidoreductase [Elioraea sp. Yellowstone]
MARFAGQRALVTGGAAGIGLATARALAAEGARLALLDIDAARLEAAAAELHAAGAEALPILGSVAGPEPVAEAFARIDARWGGLDILVNNAGVIGKRAALDLTDEDWARVMRINLDGVFFCAREAGRRMVAQGSGAIVNLGSIYSLVAAPERLAYCASKAAVAAMTKVLAIEWAAHGVRVNAVAPGYVETDLIGAAVRAGELDTAPLVRRTPVGRLARPEEIARAILFLLDPANAYVTGHVLAVDGGWTAYGYV